jgi:class 3 adenylate cyclase/pimeloyl-ACP methyl ester carboxylesterase
VTVPDGGLTARSLPDGGRGGSRRGGGARAEIAASSVQIGADGVVAGGRPVLDGEGCDNVAVDREDDVRYAISGDARLAFKVFAGGPHSIVWVPSWISNQDITDRDPVHASSIERLTSFATVVSYDQRGTGLSDPVSLAELPTLETWADDLDAVVVAAGLDQVVLFASVAAAPVAVLYAATRPERTRALVLVNSFSGSHDVDAAVSPEDVERYIGWVDRVWGTGRFLRSTMPDVPVDEVLLRDLARGERQSMAPAVVGAWLRWLYTIDVQALLPAISAPTLVLHTVQNRLSSIERARYVAERIPNARLVELPGADVSVFLGSATATVIFDELEEFLTGSRATTDHTRMVVTMMFTDIVGSTDRVAAIGDRAWRAVLDRHDDAVRHQLARFSGHLESFTGDGVLATFDGPARAIRCGIAIRDAARQIGIDVRVGIHTGEVERRGTELAGVAVHLAHRVCETAQPGDVLVSRTVVDLVTGSSITFADRGDYELKGLPETWRLFAVNA